MMIALVALVGCGKEEEEKAAKSKATPTKLIANPIVEKAIRESLEKPPGELTNADLEKLEWLETGLRGKQLTEVKGLEKLTKLTVLNLQDNPALTKAQIDELQKALPKCYIRCNPTK